jgi:hypothetical protein
LETRRNILPPGRLKDHPGRLLCLQPIANSTLEYICIIRITRVIIYVIGRCGQWTAQHFGQSTGGIVRS